MTTEAFIQKGGGLQVVIGLGQSGLATANYLARRGYRVAVTDANVAPNLAEQLEPNVDIRSFGAVDADLLLSADRIIISPGVALTTPAVKQAQQAGIAIVSDIQLFKEACQAPIVAITGSNAKSTVTTLVGQMAKNAGIKVGVGGNIGVPALSLLEDGLLGDKMQLAVLELSSFQLETISSLGAKVATVLNMSPDHLDRHGDMLSYHQAKHRIFQGAHSIVINRDDALSRPLVADDMPCLSVGSNAPDLDNYGLITEGDGQIYLAKGAQKLINADELKIKGKHNLLNALSALALGELAGIPLESMLKTLQEFAGLPHRCQFVDNVAGVDYFNDSKGTNVGSTLAAILGLGSVYEHRSDRRNKLLLILGGQGKGQQFGELAPLINKYVSQLLLIGEDANIIATHLQQAQISDEVGIHHCQTLEQAMQKVQSLTTNSLSQVAAVLLSPACASLDQYPNYNKRGEHFCQLVTQLASDK
ncbi:UDP-N-acetylmuramoyl-L-alanine--D-glutamate ligase [Psychrobacter lutiphocae]|uniref:UDP-N-acetylmuramoyl-L-alanine--D-glutamate ligase n=1 Tax=Psychrobacter lutiphocae TaxID=540500 RepID=UPI000477CBDD|nr:UDP-N-acetylmuramoyl-L-alanine--D-glutamate ligase [Psychrobacter lutiphocae]